MNNDDTISRAAAIKALRQWRVAISTERAVAEIEHLPSVPPQVEHGCYCRECKYGSKQGGYNSVGEAYTCVNCTRLMTQAHRGLIMPEDGFCSLGKPKEAKK